MLPTCGVLEVCRTAKRTRRVRAIMTGGVRSRLVVGVIVLFLLPIVSGDSAVELGEVVRLGEVDLGLEGATISPDGEIVIAHGADSSIFLIEASRPQAHSKLIWDGSETLLDADFHPGGQTAFIVGDEGVVLRFTRADSAIGSAGGELYFGETKLRAVSWNADGSWAYIGGELGWIWRARSLEGGGMEVHPIEGRGASDVNGIACLESINICVVSTSVDGIGVIDADHELHWIGGTGYPWIDATCPSKGEHACVVISNDKNIATVDLDVSDTSTSKVSIVQLQDVDGQFNGITEQSDGKSIVTIVPYSMIEHDLFLRLSFPWLENADAVSYDPAIAGERLVATWATSEYTGWVLTSTGTVIAFSPSPGDRTGGILGIWMGVLIVGSAIGIILSLIVSSSPRLSMWLTMRVGSEEERRGARREQRRKDRR